MSSSIQSIQTTTYNNGECFKQVTNKDGNITEVYYIPSDSSEEVLLLENIYDSLGNLLQTIEHTDDTTQSTYYYRDKFGNINLLNTTQHGLDMVKESIFDDEGNQTELTYSIEDLDIVQAYEYTYTLEPESTLSSVSLPIEDMYQSIITDHLGRPQKVQLINNYEVNSPVTLQNITTSSTQPLHYLFSTSYDYLKRGDHTSNLVSNIRYGLDDKYTDYLSYKYDDKGNITEIYENNLLICRYKYDALSRIIREDNKVFGKTYTWSYDAGGNILSRFEYDFTLRDELRDKTPTIIPYAYSNDFTDQLMLYNGTNFKYDSLGNPTTYRDNTLVWERGRQLKSFGDIASYTYNVSGIRTSKQIGNTTTKYFLDGNRILAQVDTVSGVDNTTVTTTTEYIYGADGITGFVLEGIPYYYKKNLQGDIIGILDSNLQIVTKYTYDAWGNCKTFYLNNGNFVDIDSTIGYNESNAEDAELVDYRYIAIKNPFRYRGYYYDVETGLYYLNSRYYDPELGRFISIDDISVLDITNIAVNGLNLYAYCLNNPVNDVDTEGNFGFLIKMLISGIINGIISAVYAIGQQFTQHGFDFAKWNVGSIGIAALGGFVAGVISAIPVLSFITKMQSGIFKTFLTNLSNILYGSTGALAGGLITGSVHDTLSGTKAVILGGSATLFANFASKYLLISKSRNIFNLNNKAKSLAIQKLDSSRYNLGPLALKGARRNSYKGYSLNEIITTLFNANYKFRLGIYGFAISGLLTGWY